MVAIEGVPALISISLETLQGTEPVQATTIPLSGNVLDVVITGSDEVIISVDNVHLPGTTASVGSEKVSTCQLASHEMHLIKGATGSGGSPASGTGRQLDGCGLRGCDVGE